MIEDSQFVGCSIPTLMTTPPPPPAAAAATTTTTTTTIGTKEKERDR